MPHVLSTLGAAPHARPSLLLQALELPRACAEYGALLSTAGLLRLLPKGTGAPVVVLPGFAGDDLSTAALRTVLRGLGHHVVGWGLGRNVGPTSSTLAGVDRLVRGLVDRHGVPVALVGWSLGGVFARRLAAARPEEVRRVVTLGSPYRLDDPAKTRAQWLYNRFEHLHDAAHEVRVGGPASRPLRVASTSIYSYTDGVVPWGACREADTALAESVAVPGSHNGLGHNPLAMCVVADRLALPPGDHSRFAPPAALRHLFRVGGAPVNR
ncbi:MAG: hypothetical protein JWN87_108 [Frankiales bacterium]|nr:hypothetical protein [Frankiales bacterium]MCW2586344.1 hypothetical protein [Frankiales bacterium]